MTTYNVNITVTGHDNASPALNSVSSALGSLASVAGGVLIAQGLTQLAGAIANTGKAAVGAAAQMQLFNISLETLAAREMVHSGAAENITTALEGIGPVADDLMGKLRDLSLMSPFTFDTVYNTFRVQMAFGATADMSIKLTGAILNTASALGLTAEATDRMAYNFAQINSLGKIMAIDLRQLRMVGLDLAEVMRDQLGMSIQEVNQALTTGQMTMGQVGQAFVDYAEENFAGAAQRMAMTAVGLKSSFKDLFWFLSVDTLGTTLETATEYLQNLFYTARDLQASGYFIGIGKQVSENADRIMSAFQDLLGADGPEDILKKIAQGIVNLSDKIADVVEWYSGLTDSQRDFLLDTAKLIIVLPLAVTAFTTLQTIITAASTLMFAFAANAATAAAVLGPLAAAIIIATQAWRAWKIIQDETATGVENATAGWQNFFNTMLEDGKTPVEILEAYRAKQAEVNAIVEDSPGIIRGYIRSKVEDIDVNSMLGASLMKASANYIEYRQAMFDAGLGHQAVAESAYDAITATTDLTTSAEDLVPAIEAAQQALIDEAEAARIAEQEQRALDLAFSILKSNIAGPLGAEIDSFKDKMGDLNEKFAENKTKIDELHTTYANTNYLTPDQREELENLEQSQVDIGDEMEEVTRKHTEQTNQIIYNLAQQQLAMSSMDASQQLAILQQLADQLGIIDGSTAQANTAIMELIAQSNVTNSQNLASAIASIADASRDGTVTTEEFKDALDILNGTSVTTTVTTNFVSSYSQIGAVSTLPPGVSPIPQAIGGDYLVTRPTLFLAGEAGIERATFIPQAGGAEDLRKGQAQQNIITIINRDRASAAFSMAYLDVNRNKKLSSEIGRA